MGLLSWGIDKNVEYSLIKYLTTQASGLYVLDTEGLQQAVTIRAGKTMNDSWELPVVLVYLDSVNTTRLEIGSNLRQNQYSIIMDIRALDDGMRLDLVSWVKTQINNGFDFYTYVPNPSNLDNPTATLTSHASVDFIGDIHIVLGDNVDLVDKYRHRLTLRVWVNG